MAQARLCEHFALQPFSDDRFSQMVTIPLPECDTETVKQTLYDDYRIEVPVGRFTGRCGIRISVQAYNTPGEIEKLIEALATLIG